MCVCSHCIDYVVTLQCFAMHLRVNLQIFVLTY